MPENVRLIQGLLKNMPGSAKPTLSADELMLQVAELSRQAASQLALERQENRQHKANELLGRLTIPSRYSTANLDSPNSSQPNAYKIAKAFVAEFDTKLKCGAGLMLWGDVGTGKTHLACAIANAVRRKMHSVLYCTAIEAVMLIKSCWKRGDSGLTEYDVYSRFADPELLILDEIDAQIGRDFERMILTNIADIRSRNCLPTIVISNLAPKEIYMLLGERMFDRLVGFGADIVHMSGKTLRIKTIE